MNYTALSIFVWTIVWIISIIYLVNFASNYQTKVNIGLQ